MNLLDTLFPDQASYEWQMQLWERAVLIRLVERIKPQVTLDVGTASGGSLAAMAPHSGKIYTVDMRHPPELLARLKPAFANAEFITGKTRDVLPPLMKQIAENKEPLEFILVDGSHGTEGVRNDLSCILQWRPPGRCVIVMHDSFNPACRRGILMAPWSSSPWVHQVEIDAIPGQFFQQQEYRRQMWGGFAIAVMDGTTERAGELEIGVRFQLLQDLVASHSSHEGGFSSAIKAAWSSSREIRRLCREAQAKKAAGKKS